MSRRRWGDTLLVTTDFFVWRTPFLPFDELVAFSQGLEAPAARDELAALPQALAADRAKLRERLRNWSSRSEVREALFLASPSLEESLDRLQGNEARENEEQREKAERTVLRYLSRMAGRATPFGLFAGCSMGRVGTQTRLMLEGRGAYRRHSRLDMDFLFSLVEAMEREPGFRSSASYRPSPDLYWAAGRLRIMEPLLQAGQRAYRLVSVEPSVELERVLAWSTSGARRDALAAALVASDPELSLTEAERFIDALIGSRLLVSDLALPVTGPEPAQELASCIGQKAALSGIAGPLSRAVHALAALDTEGPGVSPARYRAIAEDLKALPISPVLARLFQVDLVKPASEATLAPKLLEALQQGVQLLHRLHRPVGAWEMRRFREAFQQRYGDQEVPLLEALDEESGVGFTRYLRESEAEASPLLEALEFPSVTGEGSWGPRDVWLLRRLEEVRRSGQRELFLEEADLKALEIHDVPPLPDAFCVLAALGAPALPGAAEEGFRIRLDAVMGPSGATLLGRFCHADPELMERVRLHLRAEERLRPEALFVELVHLPEGRVGNILLRPVLREFELPYLGHSGAPVEQQLPLCDLRVSVEGERVRLRSVRLGRELLPRLTAAHNFQSTRNPGLYRFLCALQAQGVASDVSWSWGALAQSSFLPRVVVGRWVLSRARWQLDQRQLEQLGEELAQADGDAKAVAAYSAVQTLRDKLGLPRWVALSEGDNELPLDLDNALSVEVLVHLLRGRTWASLVELFPGPDELCARGPEGCFVHELVVPFVRAEHQAQAPTPGVGSAAAVAPTLRPLRRFAPGSEWLFAKLYCGTASAERVLREVVSQVVRDALTSGAADGWFFIRYGDPGWHVRLRLHGEPRRLLGEVLPALHAATQPLLADGSLHQLQLDTYEREVERYGGPAGIPLAEQLFQADSEAALDLIAAVPGDVDGRWQLALCGADRLLADLGLQLAERLRVLEQAREAFGREFRVEGGFERQLGRRYRKERTGLEQLLAGASPLDGPLATGLDILQRRSAKLVPVMAALREAEAAGRLFTSVLELARSFLHMQMNRLLRSAARAQELVLYDFLHRLYRSQAARKS